MSGTLGRKVRWLVPCPHNQEAERRLLVLRLSFQTHCPTFFQPRTLPMGWLQTAEWIFAPQLQLTGNNLSDVSPRWLNPAKLAVKLSIRDGRDWSLRKRDQVSFGSCTPLPLASAVPLSVPPRDWGWLCSVLPPLLCSACSSLAILVVTWGAAWENTHWGILKGEHPSVFFPHLHNGQLYFANQAVWPPPQGVLKDSSEMLETLCSTDLSYRHYRRYFALFLFCFVLFLDKFSLSLRMASILDQLSC